VFLTQNIAHELWYFQNNKELKPAAARVVYGVIVTVDADVQVIASLPRKSASSQLTLGLFGTNLDPFNVGGQSLAFMALTFAFIHFGKWLANRHSPRDVYLFAAIIVAIIAMQLVTVLYFDQQNSILVQYNLQELANQERMLDVINNFTAKYTPPPQQQFHFAS